MELVRFHSSVPLTVAKKQLFQQLLLFYNDTPEAMAILKNYANTKTKTKRATKPSSLRIIDYFITNYSKSKCTTLRCKDGNGNMQMIAINLMYQRYEKRYHKVSAI